LCRILIAGEKEKVLETVTNDLASFVRSKEGAAMVCNAIDCMQAKDKKALVKSFKGKVKEYLSVEGTFCHVVIMKILTSVDDTVLIKKSIINVNTYTLSIINYWYRKSIRT